MCDKYLVPPLPRRPQFIHNWGRQHTNYGQQQTDPFSILLRHFHSFFSMGVECQSIVQIRQEDPLRALNHNTISLLAMCHHPRSFQNCRFCAFPSRRRCQSWLPDPQLQVDSILEKYYYVAVSYFNEIGTATNCNAQWGCTPRCGVKFQDSTCSSICSNLLFSLTTVNK